MIVFETFFCHFQITRASSSRSIESYQGDLDDPAAVDFLAVPHRALDKAEEIARRVWEAGWDVVHHQHLPKWLR